MVSNLAFIDDEGFARKIPGSILRCPYCGTPLRQQNWTVYNFGLPGYWCETCKRNIAEIEF